MNSNNVVLILSDFSEEAPNFENVLVGEKDDILQL